MAVSRTKKSGALRSAREAMYRQHILDVAERLFAEQGYAQTRMQDIAHSAEISLTTLYQMFPGKQDLYRKILVLRDEEMFRRVAQGGAEVFSGAGGVGAVLALMRTQVGFLLEHPDYLRLQLQEGRLWFHSDTRPSEAEQQLWERGMALMGQLFQWGIRENLFIQGKPEEMARMLLALQQTRLANWVLDSMRGSHEDVVAQVQADFVRCFCRPTVAAGLLNEQGDRIATS